MINMLLWSYISSVSDEMQRNVHSSSFETFLHTSVLECVYAESSTDLDGRLEYSFTRSSSSCSVLRWLLESTSKDLVEPDSLSYTSFILCIIIGGYTLSTTSTLTSALLGLRLFHLTQVTFPSVVMMISKMILHCLTPGSRNELVERRMTLWRCEVHYYYLSIQPVVDIFADIIHS